MSIEISGEIMVNVDALEIHVVSEITPLLTSGQLTGMMQSINDNGQLEPILLYRGKIVDGRNRLNAFKGLGLKTIRARELPNNTTLEELKSIVVSKEVRRHQTPTQLAIFAWKLIQDRSKDGEKLSIRGAAGITSSSSANISRVNKIVDLLGVNVINKLYVGEKYNIGTLDRPVGTNSLDAIVKHAMSLQNMIQSKDEDIDDLNIYETRVAHKITEMALKESLRVQQSVANALYNNIHG